MGETVFVSGTSGAGGDDELEGVTGSAVTADEASGSLTVDDGTAST
jgi:hypothetical protein